MVVYCVIAITRRVVVERFLIILAGKNIISMHLSSLMIRKKTCYKNIKCYVKYIFKNISVDYSIQLNKLSVRIFPFRLLIIMIVSEPMKFNENQTSRF